MARADRLRLLQPELRLPQRPRQLKVGDVVRFLDEPVGILATPRALELFPPGHREFKVTGVDLDYANGHLFCVRAAADHPSLPSRNFTIRWGVDWTWQILGAEHDPPEPEFRNAIVPLPREADAVSVQLWPQLRITSHLPGGPQEFVLRCDRGNRHFSERLKIERPATLLAMEASRELGGRVKPGSWMLQAADRTAPRARTALWQWCNIDHSGRICWGRGNSPPGNPRQAWAQFWESPANDHLTRYQDVKHGLACFHLQHQCAGVGGLRCVPQHACTAPLKHHVCAQRAEGGYCFPHAPTRVYAPDPLRVDFVSNLDLDSIRHGRMHVPAEHLAVVSRHTEYHYGQFWLRCACHCCLNQLRASTTPGSHIIRCMGCGVEALYACACCLLRCTCLTQVDRHGCRCCAGRCVCRRTCLCCDGRCTCRESGCVCGLESRLVELATTIKLHDWNENADRWLHGQNGVTSDGHRDAVLLSDLPEVVAKVPPERLIMGCVVAWVKRKPGGWVAEVAGGDETFELTSQEVQVCV